MAESDGTADAPLMRHEEDEGYDNQETAALHRDNLTSPSAFVWALTLTAGISGLLFGYEYSVLFHIENNREADCSPVQA